MKLATLKNGSKDGRLVVVSRNLKWAVDAIGIAPNLLTAIETWDDCRSRLETLYGQLNGGSAAGAFGFEPGQASAPLP